MIGINNKYPSPFIIPCVKCSKDIKLYTHQRAFAFRCISCGAYNIYHKQKALKSNYTFLKPKDLTTTFTIGTVFKIDDLEFVLVNYIVKEETNYKTSWVEYSLFHPVEGYWTLSESDGHYNLMKPHRYYLQNIAKAKQISIEGKGNFQLYSKYKFKVKYAAGEFFSDIQDKDLPACADFVCSPYLLSYEKTSDEILWYLGEYIEPKKIKSWISEDVDFPGKEGVAPNQPFGLNFSQTSLIRMTVASVILLMIAQFVLSSFITNSHEVSKQSYYQTDNVSQRTYVSQPFDISVNNCAVDFELNSDLSNNWLETDFTLINETSGDQYYFTGALEHYSGYTDGESWSEGSNQTTLTVSHLKKGKYHFNVLVANDVTKPFGFLSIRVVENVDLLSNFFIAMACLIIFPVYIYYKRKRFDRKQWYNSDYSPYNYE